MIKTLKKQIPAALVSGATIFGLQMPMAAHGAMLEEVLVTARKRAESLQEAPLSVSVLNQQNLVNAGVQNLADITELVPNLQINRPSPDANVYIRGVGPTRGATNVTELSVGVYIDDVFLLKPKGQLIDLAEIESVQVLRGPQGTLFGKNTTGGALVVTTVKPSEEMGGYGQVTVGNDGRFNVQASIDLPINDQLLTKFTATSVEDDGFADDPISGKELSNEDRQGFLAQLRYLPSDDVTVDVSAYHSRIRQNLLANGDCVVTNPDAQIAANSLIAPGFGDLFTSDFCELYSDGVAAYDPTNPAEFKLDASQLSANVQWELNDNTQLKSVTAWRTQESPNNEFTNTYAGFPAGQNSLKDGESTQISQEFQLTGELADGSVRYTAGLFYMNDDSDTGLLATYNGVQGIWGSVTAEVPPGLVAALTQYNERGQENENDTYAVYTQWSWDATENLELTAGLRYGYEERQMNTRRQNALSADQAYADIPGAIIIPGTTALIPRPIFDDLPNIGLPLPLDELELLEDDENFDSLTPMFTASYRLPESMLSNNLNGLMLYASYTEGYKAGGFSEFGNGALEKFEEEEISNIEVGFKLDALENRLRVNAALFSMEYDDMQLFVARPDPDPNTISTFQGVTNAGEASITGLELEVSFVPAEGWLVMGSASLADGEFDEFNDSRIDPDSGQVLVIDRSDEDLPSLPESTFSLAVQYEWTTSIGEWTARADAYYRDEMYWGFDSVTWDIPLARENSATDSFTLYNARLNLKVNDSLSVSLWGKNLTDEHYYDGGVAEGANLGTSVKGFAPPLRYGVDLRYSF
ncbi:MAG: TonB-dependent receptor [Halioglobus sp.]